MNKIAAILIAGLFAAPATKAEHRRGTYQCGIRPQHINKSRIIQRRSSPAISKKDRVRPVFFSSRGTCPTIWLPSMSPPLPERAHA